jgi:HEPN domain-containing protein
MGNNFKPLEEWFKQADYDLETASAMFKAGRYIYTVFMCHLCIEKALKGLYAKKFKIDPPKTHDLIYLVEKIELKLDESNHYFLEDITDLSVLTRYPDEIENILKQLKKYKTEKILNQTKELLSWLKKDLKK